MLAVHCSPENAVTKSKSGFTWKSCWVKVEQSCSVVFQFAIHLNINAVFCFCLAGFTWRYSHNSLRETAAAFPADLIKHLVTPGLLFGFLCLLLHLSVFWRKCRKGNAPILLLGLSRFWSFKSSKQSRPRDSFSHLQHCELKQPERAEEASVKTET